MKKNDCIKNDCIKNDCIKNDCIKNGLIRNGLIKKVTKNIIKKSIGAAGFFAAAFAMMLIIGGITARADVIYEPENDFYRKHFDECSYINRVYVCNGPDGETTVYKSPESGKVKEKISNGKEIYISYVYTDREDIGWGYYEDYQEDTDGWIPMPYLKGVYDEEAFCEEHSSEFISESGSFSPDKACTMYLFKYPSAENFHTFDFNQEQLEDAEVYYSTVFTDECGNRWGKIGYFYGLRNYWICIDNPCAELSELYPDGAPERKLEEVPEYSGEKIVPGSSGNKSGDSGDPDDEIVPKKDGWGTVRTILIIVFIVALVVFISAKVLLCVQKRTRAKQQSETQDRM